MDLAIVFMAAIAGMIIFSQQPKPLQATMVADSELGHEVNYVPYPNLHIAQMVKEAGYKAAFTIKYGNVDKASNIFALERVPIFHTEETNKDFIERIRYQSIFESFGWMKN